MVFSQNHEKTFFFVFPGFRKKHKVFLIHTVTFIYTRMNIATQSIAHRQRIALGWVMKLLRGFPHHSSEGLSAEQ